MDPFDNKFHIVHNMDHATARDIMLDLETVDNKPTSAIASIGACRFDKDGVYDRFYCVVDHTSCIELGMTMSDATMAFWSKQAPQARIIFDAATPKLHIKDALQAFASWYRVAGGAEVWGNGADFDNAIMINAYDKIGANTPWKYSNNRCFRTLKNGAYIQSRSGTYHNALDDAITQAQYVIDQKLMPAR